MKNLRHGGLYMNNLVEENKKLKKENEHYKKIIEEYKKDVSELLEILTKGSDNND